MSAPLNDLERHVANLSSADALEQIRAENALKTSTAPERVPLLVRLASDGAAQLAARERAVRLLVAIGGREALAALSRLAKDAQATLRAAAASGLAQAATGAASVGAVGDLLKDPSRTVRAAAIKSLERLGPDGGASLLPDLLDALKKTRDRVKAELSKEPRVPSRSDDPVGFEVATEQSALVERLTALLASAEPDATRRLWASLPELLAIVREPRNEDPGANLHAGSRAAHLIAELCRAPGGPPGLARDLAAILDDGARSYNGSVLEGLVRALGRLGGPVAVDALERERKRPRMGSWEATGYPETVRAALLEARRGSKGQP